MTIIAFEGLDGAGKTTQVEIIKKWLRSNKGLKVHSVSTGDSFVGPLLKKYKKTHKTTPATLSLLYAADLQARYDHDIEPKLENEGYDVILCDRYMVSLFVRDGVRGITTASLDMPNADITLYFKSDPKLNLRRKGKAGFFEAGLDIHPSEDKNTAFIDFQTEIKDEYELLLRRRDGIYNIDATKSIAEVTEQIKAILTKELGL